MVANSERRLLFLAPRDTHIQKKDGGDTASRKGLAQIPAWVLTGDR
jgi:hypothetical protein